jgi:hypothetical protein
MTSAVATPSSERLRAKGQLFANSSEFRDKLALTKRRAQLIARDQVSKYSGELTRHNQTSAGNWMARSLVGISRQCLLETAAGTTRVRGSIVGATRYRFSETVQSGRVAPIIDSQSMIVFRNNNSLRRSYWG